MNTMKKLIKVLSIYPVFAFLLIAITPLSVQAHPHNWITVKSEFLIDEKGQLTTVREYWEFDIYFSMMTIADVMHESTVQPNSLQLLADDMINNMESYQYFSSLKISNQTVPLGRPDKYELIINTIEGQQQLVLFMDFQLAKPLPLNNQPLLWQVYDPTYYIDMRHHDTSQIIITNKRGTECTTTIDLAEPTQEMAEYAMSLDRSQTETQGLGKSFAEKIIIKCLEPTLNISM